MGGPSSLRSEVAIEERSDHYRAEIRIEAGNAATVPRVVEAESCAAVTEAAVLYLVLASAPEPAPAEPLPAASAPVPVEEPVQIVARAKPVADISKREPRLPKHPPWSASVAIGPGLDRGSMPETTPFMTLAVALGRGPWSGELSGAIWQTHLLQSPGADHGATFDLWSVAAQACAAHSRYQFCAGPEIGVLESQAFGIPMPMAPAMTWLAGLATARVNLLRGSLGEVQVRAQAVVPIYRDRFRFSQETPLYQPDRVGARLGISYLYHFLSPD